MGIKRTKRRKRGRRKKKESEEKKGKDMKNCLANIFFGQEKRPNA